MFCEASSLLWALYLTVHMAHRFSSKLHYFFTCQFYSAKSLPSTLVPRAPVTKKHKGVGAEALPEHFIFVPFQVETDSQIISNSPWIKCMGKLYQHLANVIDKTDNPHLHIVIKEHPPELKRHDGLHRLHPRIVFANYCETQQLIERSQKAYQHIIKI